MQQTAHLKGAGVTTSCCRCAHNWRCFVFFNPLHLWHPSLSRVLCRTAAPRIEPVLCTLQDSCSLRSAYFQSPSAICMTSSVQIPARVPAVLSGFSSFLRCLQTDTGIILYLKLGHDHCLSHLFKSFIPCSSHHSAQYMFSCTAAVGLCAPHSSGLLRVFFRNICILLLR